MNSEYKITPRNSVRELGIGALSEIDLQGHLEQCLAIKNILIIRMAAIKFRDNKKLNKP